ncbi:MAG: hypothetical protein SGARI_004119 [Bacillariaceae sp.]
MSSSATAPSSATCTSIPYCEEYINTPTQYRNSITTQVLQKLEDVGARFVKMDGDHFILCDERAASHKVTKHLRLQGQEKHIEIMERQREEQTRKRRAAVNSQDYLSPKRSRINYLATPNSTATANAAASMSSPRGSLKIWDNHGLPSNKYNAPTTLYYDDEDDNSESSSDDDNDNSILKPGRPVWQKLERNSDRVETDASWNRNYGDLKAYFEQHGHTGVSPDWEGDEVLAEWATRQRQLFREIQSGYRIATKREESRWQQLQLLNFPLNYESWHWERKYSQLKEILDGETFVAEAMDKLPGPLQKWLEHQQVLLQPMPSKDLPIYGKVLEKDKRERLKSLGV